jgi:transcriptional regulator with XRE-family HTH domain
MAKSKEKNEALSLRKLGYSISDISRKLMISKSTVSIWCRDITLSDKAIARIAKKSKSKSTTALLHYSESVRLRRQINTSESIKSGKQKLGVISDRDIYCIGLGLYWGEGYKRGSQEFGFTNSDANMVLFYLRWLETVFEIKKNDLILRVSINEMHRSRMNEVEQFWSKLTGVPRTQFTKMSLIKMQSKKVYTLTKHMGTLRIKVRRGTSLRREVLGSLEGIVLQI